MTYKPTGALKKLVDLGKVDTRVLGSVERFLLSKPADTSRRTDVLHPSAMVKDDWCYRASYFELQGAEPAPSKYKTSLKQAMVFDEGHHIHHRWQTWFKEMGRLKGKYECLECGDVFFGLPNDHDPEAPASAYEYLEVPLYYEPLRISGHADGWLVDFNDPLLLEIKSVGIGTFRWETPDLFFKHDGNFEKIWKDVETPFYTHIQQAQMYMKLMELIGYEDAPKEALVLYESKATQDVKEFVIQKSDFGIQPLFDAAQMIVDSISAGVMPDCNINGAAGCRSCNHHMEQLNAKNGN
jgi:hypothetical protein